MPRASHKPAFKHSHSAGGFVTAVIDGVPSLLLIKNTFDGRWTIPKGHLDPGENAEQAAIREVQEETGLDATILEPLGKNTYKFRADRIGRAKRNGPVLIDKRVDVFLMETADPTLDPAKFDPLDKLVADAKWFPASAAVPAIGYANLRELAAKAAEKVTAHAT